jgi:hypothetical protein
MANSRFNASPPPARCYPLFPKAAALRVTDASITAALRCGGILAREEELEKFFLVFLWFQFLPENYGPVWPWVG